MIAMFAITDESMGEWYCVVEGYYFLGTAENLEEANKKAEKVQFKDEDGKEIPHTLKFVEYKIGKTCRKCIGVTHYHE
jgi:hypothetical protein